MDLGPAPNPSLARRLELVAEIEALGLDLTQLSVCTLLNIRNDLEGW